MENTLENKQKLFYQYWGQGLIKVNSLPKHKNKPYPEILNDYHLLLKPLSSITNEDAIKVGRIVFPNLNDTQLILVKDGVINMFPSGWNTDGLKMLKIFDYLRSKGYALPFMGLSVKTMVEYGWIKLK